MYRIVFVLFPKLYYFIILLYYLLFNLIASFL